MIGFLYKWLDLFGPDGKPSNSKVLATTTQFTLLGTLVVLAARAMEVSSGFVAYSLVVAVMPIGLDGLKTLLKLRAGTPAP
jgi:hypothetical protein